MKFFLLPLFFLALVNGCGSSKKLTTTDQKAQYATIDLNHWKVTIPTPKANGKPLEVSPPEILDYDNNPDLKDYMYNDTTDGSIVFYTYPASSTANSSSNEGHHVCPRSHQRF